MTPPPKALEKRDGVLVCIHLAAGVDHIDLSAITESQLGALMLSSGKASCSDGETRTVKGRLMCPACMKQQDDLTLDYKLAKFDGTYLRFGWWEFRTR